MIPQLLSELKWADIVHAHGEFFITTIQASLLRSLIKYPLLIHVHGSLDYPRKSPILIKVKEKLYDPTIELWTLKHADAIASISKRGIQLIKAILRPSDKYLFWLPNAIDLSIFKYNSNKQFSGTIAFIGRLVPWKGIEIFVKVAKLVSEKHPKVQFIVVGDGKLLNTYRDLYGKYVRFLGAYPYEKIPQLLDSIDILCLPSYFENVPTVILEAMAKQIPVIASNVGGIPEVVIHGKTGYLIPPSDLKSYVQQILYLLENPSEIKRLGRNALEFVEAYHDIKKVVKMVESSYKSIIN
jgi:glycosyltransferase involved in cell wall biosynthesis